MSKLPSFKGKLIASGSNAKTIKGDDEYVTAIMYLAPFTEAGVGNVCPMAAIAGCFEGCLNTAGRAGMFQTIGEARRRKTRLYMKERGMFLNMLVTDLERFVSWCARKGVKPAVRLNGTSDIMWEKGHPVTRDGVRFDSVMVAFPEIAFYDYSKIYTRVDKPLPSNYSLTLSYSGANGGYAHSIRMAFLAGHNVAVVFRNRKRVEQALAEGFFGGGQVFDGDKTDMRFMDPKGVVVALYAKGRAKKDVSGFVVD